MSLPSRIEMMLNWLLLKVWMHFELIWFWFWKLNNLISLLFKIFLKFRWETWGIKAKANDSSWVLDVARIIFDSHSLQIFDIIEWAWRLKCKFLNGSFTLCQKFSVCICFRPPSGLMCPKVSISHRMNFAFQCKDTAN